MQGRSSDVDVFMSLTSRREGAVFNRAGWYADLAPLMADKALTAPDFNYEDFGASIRARASTFGNQVGRSPDQPGRAALLLAQGHLRALQDRRAQGA